ncbi:50S ribosomal protein L14 [Gracilariopsis chorda]|uniref:50S ribosomal protein L14 n=1 Tax=Gracilariopsis chorda TaxID=448386 RepID=A0A2V3J3Q7_9FLOR|nr:50S ribosomal protein L14 [Gracilariopsis chorda]|eukprot:PXF49096.1 50S ribosomal protein L14 [Gracilariopsis chorda]
MVQMRTVLRVADNSGAKTVRCINILRRQRQRPSGNVGSELVVSVTANDRSVTNKKAKKGEIHRALVIRSKNEPLRKDGGFMRTGETAAILLNADGAPLGTRIRGPVSAALDRKRFLKVLSLSRATLFSTLACPNRNAGTSYRIRTRYSQG